MDSEYRKKYLKYKGKYLKLKSIEKKIIMNGGGKDAGNTINLFKAEWCGHCKAFKPTWEKLMNELGNKIKFITFDSETDAKMITEYKIEGFPTIIMIVNNKAIEYVGPRDEQSLRDFINQYN
jgi:thiol-disulfide isomerase/thioredoxin